MDGRRDQPASVWVGVTNDILDPAPNGLTQAPVVLTAQEAAELFTSFQHLVYLTVLLGTGSGRTSLRQLTDAERSQYELLIETVRIDSFFARFRSHEEPANIRGSADATVTTTVQWIFAAMDTLGDSEWLFNAADMVPDALALVNAVVLPIIQAYAGNPVAIEAGHVFVIVAALAAFVRLSWKLNRQLSVRLGDKERRPTRTQVDAVRRLDKALTNHQKDGFDTETRPFSRRRGVIVDALPASHKLSIRFRDDSDPVACQYDPSESYALGNLNEGDSIEAEGSALHMRGDPIDANPVLIKITDWGGLQHRFAGQYKT